MRPAPSNDPNFDPRAQLANLSEEEALAYAGNLLDANCEERDAAYLKAVLTAGEESVNLTYEHALGGSGVAQFIYGAAKLMGTYTDQNTAEGFFWLRRAHNNGTGRASALLAAIYLEGRLIGRDAAKALAYVTPAAEQGVSSAQYVLATVLLDGEVVPVDEDRAIALLRDSASKGYAQAADLLAANGIPLS